MANEPHVNTQFEEKALRLLEKIEGDHKATVLHLMAKVEKIDTDKLDKLDLSKLEKIDAIEATIKELNNKISDIEKADITQNNNIKVQETSINNINTLVRWVGLLIIGTVLVAILNLVILDNTRPQVPTSIPTMQQSLYRDEMTMEDTNFRTIVYTTSEPNND